MHTRRFLFAMLALLLSETAQADKGPRPARLRTR